MDFTSGSNDTYIQRGVAVPYPVYVLSNIEFDQEPNNWRVFRKDFRAGEHNLKARFMGNVRDCGDLYERYSTIALTRDTLRSTLTDDQLQEDPLYNNSALHDALGNFLYCVLSLYNEFRVVPKVFHWIYNRYHRYHHLPVISEETHELAIFDHIGTGYQYIEDAAYDITNHRLLGDFSTFHFVKLET